MPSSHSNRYKHRQDIREFLAKEKSKPCKDCKILYSWFVMDFDHLSNKKYEINFMVKQRRSLEAIKKEISKCEIVCSNCHRTRTYIRNLFKKKLLNDREIDTIYDIKKSLSRRNKFRKEIMRFLNE